jgi:hypothetical protein
MSNLKKLKIQTSHSQCGHSTSGRTTSQWIRESDFVAQRRPSRASSTAAMALTAGAEKKPPAKLVAREAR